MNRDCKDFLLEINVEDLPAGYVMPALGYLESAFLEEFKRGNISYNGNARTLGTKNSLILRIDGLSPQQENISQEILGPPKRIAFDEDGRPTKQAIGFAKNQGVKPKDLKIKSTPKGEYVVIEKKLKAKSTKDILREITPRIIKDMRFPKTMRWDDSGVKFARPIESILLLFGRERLGIKLGRVPQKKIKNMTPAEYLKQVQKRCSIDYVERKGEIEKSILKATEKLGSDSQCIDGNLLEEVTFMVSSPEVFVGGFDKKFLNLPEDVLKASMSKYQRLFPVSKNKRLINKFIAVIEGNGRDIRAIKKNYEFILEARLKDSLFFFKEDTKKGFSENAVQLKDLIFHKDLGNMFEKSERLKELSSFICERLKLKESMKTDIKRAAGLSKLDLTTHMVGEFPSLQGIMGSVYAKKSGENPRVAQAIGEHYLPQGMDDNLPQSLEGAVLAISDRIDNIVGFLGMGVEISGSFDPFGVRRNALGLIRIIKDKSLRINIEGLIQKAIESYGGKLRMPGEKLKARIIDYIKERIEFLMGEVRPLELKKAVLESSFYDIVDIFKRVRALSSISSERYFLEAAKVVERTSNILKGAKNEKIGNVDEKLFEEDLERKLWKVYLSSKDKIQGLINKKQYKEATKEYGESFFKILHDFFDKVLVNAEDRSLRLNRLAVMKAINKLYTDGVADLAKLPQIVVG